MTTTNLNTAAFDRLRWPIFDDISNIQVMDDPDCLTTTLSPFLDHSIAEEPATDACLVEMLFNVGALLEFEGLDFEPPDDLVVSRDDGGTVTVGDVVAQLHEYFNVHKQDILQCLAPVYNTRQSTTDGKRETVIEASGNLYQAIPEGKKVFFNGFGAGIIEPHAPVVEVELWCEGQDGRSAEYYWKSRASPLEYPL
ncbi:hypothetical protein DM02DRAFT_618148 [Periconia macrospinosa]|uniref:Uncharacterized protein n=1 Tax=Periconia macrospinosa TaxID=97972 RepID=A0A2V1DAE5_9PLEO|nr:hypothetical protein DM02DRAFT_618148 [Periconia macrospinosa]